MLTGVVEVGLFCGMAKAAYFGNPVGAFFLPFRAY
jgi:ribose 5-phosphate isomerase A